MIAKNELKELMRSFYTICGIRFVLFDVDGNCILAYPEGDCDFCQAIKGNKSLAEKCLFCDKLSFEKCKKQNELIIYKCHAGLLEASMALRSEEGEIIGYLMLGQVLSKEDSVNNKKKLLNYGSNFGIPKRKLSGAINNLVCKTNEEINSSYKVMEVCASYILLKELIVTENSKLLKQAKDYIEKHIEESFTVKNICDELKIGRTKLYEIFASENQTGVSEYIRHRRMHRAKKLLQNTDLPISEIAYRVGFSEYNYFGIVFKKTYGCSPRNFRNKKNKKS